LTTGLNLASRRTAAALTHELRNIAAAPSDIAQLLSIPNSIFEIFNPDALISRNVPKFLRVKIVRNYQGGGFYNYVVRDESGKEFSVFTDQLLPVGSFHEAEAFNKRVHSDAEGTFLEQALRQVEKIAHVPAKIISSAGGGGV
jgi:hypothetical protein